MSRPLLWWAILLGIALGGFFDGILLHQILQWHHLLSLVDSVGDLRAQVLWDGYFHALMYIISAVALWRLWRNRREAQMPSAGLYGALLIGFATWHAADAVLSHWLLGIHRIKVDSPDPLFWDLAWLVAFGLVPLAAGTFLLRGAHGHRARPRGSALSVLIAASLAAGAGAWPLLPPQGQPFTMIAFWPGTETKDVLAAIKATDARLVWADSTMGVVVLHTAPGRAWRFYAHGALLVSGAGMPAGCFSPAAFRP